MLAVNYFWVPKGNFYFIWYDMAWKQYIFSYSFVLKYSWKQYYFKIVVITYSFVNSVIFLFQSEAADTVSGMADPLPHRTREHLHDVANHLLRNVANQLEDYGEHFGNIALESLNAARERLNEIHSRFTATTATRDMRKELTWNGSQNERLAHEVSLLDILTKDGDNKQFSFFYAHVLLL